MRRHLRTIVLILLAVISQRGKAQDSTTAPIGFLPGEKIFPLFVADGLSHQLSLVSLKTGNGLPPLADPFPLFSLTCANAQMQASVAVTIFNRLIKAPGHLTVYTVDCKVDVPMDIRFPELSLRVAMGHVSYHFADDAIELLGRRSIQYVNDYVTLAAAYDVEARSRVD